MNCFKTDGVAFVSGGGRGIGRATAIAFAQSGATAVVVADLDGPEAESVAAELKSSATNPNFKATGIRMDATKREDVDSAVSKTVAEHGRIDYYVHSVGIPSPASMEIKDYDMEVFNHIIDVNTNTVMICSGAVTKAMLKQESRTWKTSSGNERDIGRGSIVVVLSGMSLVALPGRAAYTTAKHASLGVTKVLALDVGRSGIRVNYVAPTWVRTRMFESDKSTTPNLEGIINAVVPAGRPAEPDEVASGIIYLSSPAASYVHGAGLLIDAGTGLSVVRQM